MKRIISLSGFLILCFLAGSGLNAQTRNDSDTPDRPQQQPQQRPTTFEMVDGVRNALKLDHKEFDKVYSAYQKYNKSVFGDENTMSIGGMGGPGAGPRGGGGGMGRPGGMGGPGGGGPGGMGRPGGMGGPGGGGPGGDFSRDNDRNNKNFNPEKFEKTKTKAEEKMCKSIKKIFKKEPEKYQLWTKLRDEQLKQLFPEPPHKPNPNDPNDPNGPNGPNDTKK